MTFVWWILIIHTVQYRIYSLIRLIRLFVSHNIWIVHYLFYNCVLENFFHREHTQTRSTDGTYVVDCDVRDDTGDMTLWYPRYHIIRKGTKGGITEYKKRPKMKEKRSTTTTKTGSNESAVGIKNSKSIIWKQWYGWVNDVDCLPTTKSHTPH